MSKEIHLVRNKWCSISYSNEYSWSTIHFDIPDKYDDRTNVSFCMRLFGLFVFLQLPIKAQHKVKDLNESLRYGVTYDLDSLRFNFGEKSICLRMPWDLEHYRTGWLMKTYNGGTRMVYLYARGKRREGEWMPYELNDLYFPEDKTWSETHDYIGTTKSGAKINTKATIRVVHREWRRLWLPFMSLFSFSRKQIDIQFDPGVGDDRSGWKGPMTGCSYDMKPGETPLECLRRMEAERTF